MSSVRQFGQDDLMKMMPCWPLSFGQISSLIKVSGTLTRIIVVYIWVHVLERHVKIRSIRNGTLKESENMEKS